MNNKGVDQTAHMHSFVRKPPKTGFLFSRPISNIEILLIIKWAAKRENQSLGFSYKVRIKPVCSAIKKKKIKKIILLIASLDIFSSKRITKTLNRLLGCQGWSASLLFPNNRPNNRRQIFSRGGPSFGIILS